MDKSEMRAKLLNNSGVGVRVKDARGIFYFFYQDFINDDARMRALRHFKDADSIKFFSVSWARQSQFKEYMRLYNDMVRLANIAERELQQHPDCNRAVHRFRYTYDRQINYLKFLCDILVKWTQCSYVQAKRQIINNEVVYKNF